MLKPVLLTLLLLLLLRPGGARAGEWFVPSRSFVQAPSAKRQTNLYRPGTNLGSGGNKLVFTIPGHPTRALAVAKRSTTRLDPEVRDLRRLRKAGIPAVRVYAIGSIILPAEYHDR